MNPLLKWTSIAVAALGVLAGAATVALRALVDEERLRTTLIGLVNERIDGTLAIDGGVELALWPTLSLAADDLRLRVPADASEDLAGAKRLRLGVALLPLLRNELQVSELVLDGLTLNAACDDGDDCNWSALGGTGPQQATPPPADAAGATGAPMPLAIERVRVRDGTLVYTDRKTGARYTLDALALDGRAINMEGHPFRLEGGATLRPGAGQRELKLTLATDVEADGAANTVALAATSLSLAPAAGPALALDVPAAAIDLDARTFAAPALRLSADGIELDAALSADWSQPGAASAQGTLDLKRLDLPALLQVLGTALPPGVNAAPLADIAFGARFALGGDSLALDALTLRAGRFNAAGSARLGLGDATRIDASISSPELDLDYFLPPAAAPAAPPAAAATTAGDGTARPGPGGLAALLRVDGAIDAKIGRLARGALQLGDLDARVKLARGSARLEKLDATLYGGTLGATGTLAATAGSGAMNVNARLAGVDLKALLGSTGQTQKFEGRVNGTLTLAATGADPAAWKNTLSGPVQLAIDEPVLKGLSVEEVICRAAAQLNQEALSARFAPDTHFRSVRTALDFRDGVGTFRELGVAVPDMSMRGEGRIDLARGRLDVQLNTRVTDDLGKLDHACRMSRKMLAIEWPVTCKGRFDESPKQWCGIDKDDVAKIAAQLATEKVQDKLMKKLGDFLNRD